MLTRVDCWILLSSRALAHQSEKGTRSLSNHIFTLLPCANASGIHTLKLLVKDKIGKNWIGHNGRYLHLFVPRHLFSNSYTFLIQPKMKLQLLLLDIVSEDVQGGLGQLRLK